MRSSGNLRPKGPLTVLVALITILGALVVGGSPASGAASAGDVSYSADTSADEQPDNQSEWQNKYRRNRHRNNCNNRGWSRWGRKRKCAFDLNILHINDHHSNLSPRSGDLDLGGAGTRVEIGGFSRVVTKINELEAHYAKEDGADSVVKIHAGDAITGTLFYTLFGGEADAALMNEVCFDMFALGNHEFDGGDEGLKTFLDFLAADDDCDTDVLAANVKPAVGTPLLPTRGQNYLQPFTVRKINGNKVGFIGIDIANKTMLSGLSPYCSKSPWRL